MLKRRTKLSVISGILLLSFLFFAPVGYCSETTYTIAATQLTQLKNQLAMLESNNNLLLSILTEQDEQSATALTALIESRKELEKLKAQLNEAKSEMDNARQSLEIANSELKNVSKSFHQYQQETERTERRLTIQRDFWAVLSCILAGGLAVTI